MYRFLVVLLALLPLTHAVAGDYARCLLDALPGSSNDIVARASINSCLAKHPRGLEGVNRGSGLSIFGLGYSNPNECVIGEAKSTQSNFAATHIRIACARLYSERDKPRVLERIAQKAQALTRSYTQSLIQSPASAEAEPPAILPTSREQPATLKSATPENKTEEDLHYEKIYQAHPDADEIYDNAGFQDWVGLHPARKQVLDDGTTQEIIRLFSDYKAFRESSLGAALAKPFSQKNEVFRPAGENCEFKSIMTNADYAACGITPPNQSGRAL